MTENELELSRKIMNAQVLLIDISRMVLEHAETLRSLSERLTKLEERTCEHVWHAREYTDRGIVYQCRRCSEKITRGWNLS
jgi:hypothetical protein